MSPREASLYKTALVVKYTPWLVHSSEPSSPAMADEGMREYHDGKMKQPMYSV